MTPVRFGIIGSSSVARRRMVPAICASDIALLQRIGSLDVQKGEKFAREFGCSKWGIIRSGSGQSGRGRGLYFHPPALHEPWVRAAAEYGKHIFCEKPVSPNGDI